MDTHRPPTIAARDVSCEVGAALLLDGVNLTADRAQMIGLIGPNGAGKSTLLRTIAGILGHDHGAVLLDGAEIGSLSPKDIASNLALVPQVAPYTHSFTSLELVLMGRYPHLGRFQIESERDRDIARSAMALTETEKLSDRTLDTLSGGERQRVFVSRALAQKPRLLLLDEPTSNLDILHQLKVLGLVRRLVDSGLTAIAAIHDLHMAARYCDRLVLLSGGRVAATGTPEQVLSTENIESAFGVRSAVYRDDRTGSLAISLIGPADEQAVDQEDLTAVAEAVRAAGDQTPAKADQFA